VCGKAEHAKAIAWHLFPNLALGRLRPTNRDLSLGLSIVDGLRDGALMMALDVGPGFKSASTSSLHTWPSYGRTGNQP
jgi:hypothetical protein